VTASRPLACATTTPLDAKNTNDHHCKQAADLTEEAEAAAANQ